MKKLMLKSKLITCIALLSLFCIQSCKKEIFISKEKSILERPIISAKTITYDDFISSINTNSLGFLKPQMQKKANSGSKLLALADSNVFENLAVYTDSVKKFTTTYGTSYIFKMQLSSPRAISFRNLTIYVKKNGATSAFIATYTPTQEWIKAKKEKKQIEFKGDVSFTPINLASTNFAQAVSVQNKVNSTTGKIMSKGHGVSNFRLCVTYDVVQFGPIPCSSGLHHLSTKDDCEYTLNPQAGNPPGYGYYFVTITDCVDVETPGGNDPGFGVIDPGPGGSDQGSSPPPISNPSPGDNGGGTMPIPPPPYNPCDGETPIAAYSKNNKGLKLAVLPPSPCDGGDNGGLYPLPVNPFAVALQNFVTEVQITNADVVSYLANNASVFNELKSYLDINGRSVENLEYVNWAAGYLNENPAESVIALLQNGTSVYYTNSEMEGIFNSIADPITGNGIELYLVVRYQGSKLFELSRYSKSVNLVQAGDYNLTPHYSKNGTLLFYAAYRNSQNGIEYIIRANQLSSFTSKIDYYTNTADLVYMNGMPTKGMIQMMAGDRISGLKNLWADALKSPQYWLYLATLYVSSPANSVTRNAVISNLKSDIKASTYTFTNTAEAHLGNIVTRGANIGQLSRPYMNSPLTINEIMSTGIGSADATFAGGFNWSVPGTFRGSNGTWQLGINPQTKVIYHFNFVN